MPEHEGIYRKFDFRAVCIEDALKFLSRGYIADHFNGCQISMVTVPSPDESGVVEQTGGVDVSLQVYDLNLVGIAVELGETSGLSDKEMIIDSLEEDMED